MAGAEQSAIADIIGEEAYAELESMELSMGIEPQEGQVYTHEEYKQLMGAPTVAVYVTDPSDPEAEALWVGYQSMGFNIRCHEWINLPQPIAALLENSQAGMRLARKKQQALIRSMDPRMAKNWKTNK